MSEQDDRTFATSVRTEIWRSFISLLRSYAAAAASMDEKEYIVDGSSDRATVSCQDRAFRFTFRATTGDGMWRSVHAGSESWGAFHLRQDGTLAFLDGIKSLDIAAIDFIEGLSQRVPQHSLTGAALPLSSRPERSGVEGPAVCSPL